LYLDGTTFTEQGTVEVTEKIVYGKTDGNFVSAKSDAPTKDGRSIKPLKASSKAGPADLTTKLPVNPSGGSSKKYRVRSSIWQHIKHYMADLFLYENSILRDHKVGIDNEVYQGKGLAHDDYILHSKTILKFDLIKI
jgi:hypothetical protein